MQIAKNGIGSSRPNPSVGAVVVHQNKIIGEGFTSSYGENHAEVNALKAVKDTSLLKEATIYVSLEPCAHFGKTPPCADLIVKNRLKNVVIGCVDTNTLVAGKGIERLKKAGINVIVGVLEKECRNHHQRFFTVLEKKRPFIILKWAETNDGFMAPLTKNENKPVWISNKYSQQLVHKWRSEEHAILVGTNTVLADNPKLNVRSWSGKNPVRVVLDRSLRIPNISNVLDGSVKTIVFYNREFLSNRNGLQSYEKNSNIIFEEIDFTENVAMHICKVLQKHNIQSVIIEGGLQILQTFINENLWDEARVFTGETVFGAGVKSPVFHKKRSTEINIKTDILKIYIND